VVVEVPEPSCSPQSNAEWISVSAPEAWRHLVAEVVVPESDAEGEASLFDDELPPGLRLAHDGDA